MSIQIPNKTISPEKFAKYPPAEMQPSFTEEIK